VPGRYSAQVSAGGSHLERYARCLNAVEINSSFYRPHQHKTYRRWAQSTPHDFRFAVKTPKSITHDARLADCGDQLDRFAGEVAGLGDKLGALLVQLPPTLIFKEKTADIFFRELSSRLDAPVAFEPRHASWFAPQVDNWLAERKIARVGADPAPVPGARIPGGWEGFVYYRWHGAPRIYFSDYDATALASIRERIAEERARNIPVWCIFDNTGAGAAFGNALTLMKDCA
jgi:uncharacterized protein YecE (DUF72 family)